MAEAVALLDAAVSALAGVSAGGLADGELSELLCSLDVVGNRLAAVRGGLVGAWDARRVWALDGARSGGSWLACHTEAARGVASGEVRLARALRLMPVVGAAFGEGRLGVAKVRLLADAAAVAPEAFGVAEAWLVEQVVGLRVDQAARLLEFWKAHANPDGAEDRGAREHADRQLHLSRSFRGQWFLNGKLTAEAGEVLCNELDRRVRVMYRADKAVADENGTPLERSAAQRRADALIDLALQSVASTESGSCGNVAAITAVVDLDALAGGEVEPMDVVGVSERGGVVTAAMARRWSCDCSISRVVMGPGSVPVDVGMAARLASPAQRRALAVRDGGCVFPGCDAPVGWTSAHHLVHWIDDGPTDLSNLALLCVFHHHRVHEGGFGMTRLPSGRVEFTRPDGTVLQVPKHQHPGPLHRHVHQPGPRGGTDCVHGHDEVHSHDPGHRPDLGHDPPHGHDG